MTLLPATVPDIPEIRSEIVAARLARKVAPLFGVRWTGNPYDMTWVSDFTRISLTEIARGAPSATRVDLADEPAVGPGWQVSNRAVTTQRANGSSKAAPLPNEIANATLNRFGPDTKAAALLTAANALLVPVTEAVAEALAFLERTPVGTLPARLRVAAWAGLVLEAFRSQPALLSAAIQARAVQRAALRSWLLPTADDRRFARVELGQSPPTDPESSSSAPSRLGIVDDTISALRLAQPGADQVSRDVWQRRLEGEIVEHWLDRLSRVGRCVGEGLLWLTDDDSGHRQVEAFAPHDPTLWRFLTDIADLLPADTDSRLDLPHMGSPTLVSLMPTIPLSEELMPMSLLTRRATILALTTLVRLAFNSGSPNPGGDLHTLATFDLLAKVAAEVLPADDPVLAVTRCRMADMRLELVRQDSLHDAELAPAVQELLDALDAADQLARSRQLNHSDVAELMRSGLVELMVLLRRDNPDEPHWTVLRPEPFRRRLARMWERMLELLDVEIDRLGEQPERIQRLVGYQLHDYATFIGGAGDEDDAARAVALYRDFVIPAREDYYQDTAFFPSLLYSYQNATRATTRLSEAAVRKNDRDQAHEFAQLGRTWIVAALAAPYTRSMLDASAADATDEACRFALLAVPALISAVRYDASPTPTLDLTEAADLLDHAQRFADRIAKAGGRYARNHEVLELTQRLEELRNLG